MIAFTAIAYFLALLGWEHVPLQDKLKRVAKLPPREVHLSINMCYDVALSLLLAGYGEFWWASVNLIQMVFCVTILTKYYETNPAD